MRAALAVTVLAACGAAAPRAAAPARRIDEAMADVQIWLTRADRAAQDGQWTVAKHSLDALHDVFADELATSTWHGDASLAQLARAFDGDLARARSATAARDRVAYRAATARVVGACNACHARADRGDIAVASVLDTAATVVVVDRP